MNILAIVVLAVLLCLPIAILFCLWKWIACLCHKKYVKSVIYLGILMVLMLVVWILIPSICRPKESARKVACMNNLYEIGKCVRLYQLGNNEQYPPDLSSLSTTNYAYASKLFICPSSGHKAGSISNVAEWTDYAFNFNVPSNAPPDSVIGYCRAENHKNEGGNVLFVDGHVEWFTMDMYTNAVKQGRVK